MFKKIFLQHYWFFSLFVFSFNSFASEYTQTIIDARKNKLPDLPSDKISSYPYYFIVYNTSSKYYQLHISRDVMTISYKNSDNSYMLIQYPTNNMCSSKIYEDDLSSWGSFGGHSSGITVRDSDNVVVYSNYDIKDTSGTVHYVAYEINSAPVEDDDSGFWSSLFNRLTDGFSAIVDALINIFNKMIEVVQNVIDVILGIPQAILDGLSNLFEFLFVPVASRNLFDEVKILFEFKFGIFNQFRDLVESILSPSFYGGTPKFEITYKGF